MSHKLDNRQIITKTMFYEHTPNYEINSITPLETVYDHCHRLRI